MKNLYFTYILIFLSVIILNPNSSFAQHKGGKDKKNETSTDNKSIVSEIFIDALKSKIINDTPKTLELLNLCLEKNPKHSASMYELAQLYFNTNDFNTAAKYAVQAAEIEPDNKWYKLLLIEIYSKTNQTKELITICKSLIKSDPQNVEYQYELANAYLLAEDGSNAIKAYNSIEKMIGISEEVSMQKQRVYLIMNNSNMAAKEIEKLVIAFPEQQSRYYSILAEMYIKLNNSSKAAEYYQKVKETDPQNPYIHISLSDYYRKKGDMPQAFEELKIGFENPALDIDTKIRVLLAFFSIEEMYNKQKSQVMELANILVRTHPADPKAHAMYGDFLLDDKQYQAARDEFRKVIAIDSSRYAVWESLLNAEMQLHDFASLLLDSQKAIELFPFQPIPYLYKGLALAETDNYKGAIDIYNKGAKLVVNNNLLSAQFYISIGDAYHKLKDYTQSDINYEKALKIDDNNSYLLNNYSYYLALRGEKLDKALTMSEKAVKLAPNNAANLDTYGWVLFKSGNYKEALIWINKAISLSTNKDPDLFEHLGDVHFKLGDIDNAVHNWKQALDQNKDSELLKKKIKDRKLYEE